MQSTVFPAFPSRLPARCAESGRRPDCLSNSSSSEPRHFFLGQYRHHVEIHHQALDLVHFDGAAQRHSACVNLTVHGGADLAEQVLSARHRLRLFADLGKPSGDVSLQSILVDSRDAADSDGRITARDQCPHGR
jgi:hypothetical protein